jgi:hypothetical protein
MPFYRRHSLQQPNKASNYITFFIPFKLHFSLTTQENSILGQESSGGVLGGGVGFKAEVP